MHWNRHYRTDFMSALNGHPFYEQRKTEYWFYKFLFVNAVGLWYKIVLSTYIDNRKMINQLELL